MAALLTMALLATAWWLGGYVDASLPATGGAALLLFLLVWHAARGSLPRQPKALPPYQPELGPGGKHRLAELTALGFETLGEPFSVNQATPGVAMALVERRRGILAAVYEFPGGRCNTDLVTPFADGGMLTTAGVRAAGTMPMQDNVWMQIAVGATAAQQLQLHEQGVAFARKQRRMPQSVAKIDAEGFVQLLLETLRQQRAHFDRAPLRTTAIVLWRLSSGRSPYLRPVQDQHGGDGGSLSPLPH